MFVFEQEQVLFTHIPKCGGKVLRQAFLPHDPYGQHWHWNFSKQTGQWQDMAHLPLHVLRLLPEWRMLEDHTVIAVVRNPVERFVSSMVEHCAAHDMTDFHAVIAELDETRISHGPRYIHFCPQHRFTHLGNKRQVDFIARLEHLKPDLSAIGVKAHFSKAYFDALERIPDDGPTVRLPLELSKDEWEKVVRLYIRDFLLFGYPVPQDIDITAFKGTEFERLLFDPGVLAEWDGDACAKPAYERLRSVSDLRARLEAAEQELAALKSHPSTIS